MKCLYCGHPGTEVTDSRAAEDDLAVRRRRRCAECGARFSTYERPHVQDLTVIKRSGRREPFDREKLERAILKATAKRKIDPGAYDAMMHRLIRRLESLGDAEIPTDTIGEIVLRQLRALDAVAYVRFASVYREFRDADDFARFLTEEALT